MLMPIICLLRINGLPVHQLTFKTVLSKEGTQNMHINILGPTLDHSEYIPATEYSAKMANALTLIPELDHGM